MRRTRPWWLLAGLAVLWLPVLLDADTVREAAALHRLAETPKPYFLPRHALLLYLRVPLVLVSAGVLVISPGLVAGRALGLVRSRAQWLSVGLPLSLVAVVPLLWMVEGLLGKPLTGSSFVLLLVVASLIPGLAPLGHAPCGRTCASHRADRWIPASALLLSAALAAALTPKLLWESFTGDGVHTLESARLLLHQLLPFWDREAGHLASFPGFNSQLFAYPASWGLRLFGPLEAAARFPLLVYVATLLGALVAVVEAGGGRRMGLREILVCWLGAIVFLVTMAWSATYDPYAADLAAFAAQDSLLLAMILGLVWAFVERRAFLLVLFLSLAYATSPAGLLLIVLWMGAVAVVWRPRPRRELAISAGALLALVLASAAAPGILQALGQPAPGGEHSLLHLVERAARLQWEDLSRLRFLLVPTGFVPVLAMAAWRWQDRVARSLTLVAFGSFLLFYFQASAALHHFAPAMVLPLAVLWRIDRLWQPPLYRPVFAATVVGALTGLALSLPHDVRPLVAPREIGRHLRIEIPGYETMDPELFAALPLLRDLFGRPWDPRVPERLFSTAPAVLSYYAHSELTGDGPAAYVLRSADAPPPAGLERVGAQGGVTLYADSVVWREHRALRPPTPPGSPLYALPPTVLFPALARHAPYRVLFLRDVLERLGVDVEHWRARLGG